MGTAWKRPTYDLVEAVQAADSERAGRVLDGVPAALRGVVVGRMCNRVGAYDVDTLRGILQRLDRPEDRVWLVTTAFSAVMARGYLPGVTFLLGWVGPTGERLDATVFSARGQSMLVCALRFFDPRTALDVLRALKAWRRQDGGRLDYAAPRFLRLWGLVLVEAHSGARKVGALGAFDSCMGFTVEWMLEDGATAVQLLEQLEAGLSRARDYSGVEERDLVHLEHSVRAAVRACGEWSPNRRTWIAAVL